MVYKANAYGYGDVNMAQKLIKNGIKNLAVADFEEGIRLRKNNINVTEQEINVEIQKQMIM